MAGNITGGGAPFQLAIFGKAEEFTAGDIIFGICQKNIAIVGVHRNAVGDDDVFFCPIPDKIGTRGLEGIGINDAIAAHSTAGGPLIAVEIHAVFYKSHIADGLADLFDHGIGCRIQNVSFGRYIGIVAAGCYPQFAVVIFADFVKINRHRNFFDFLKGVQVHHRDGVIIIRIAVPAGVGYIKPVAHHFELVGLQSYSHPADNLKRFEIHFDNIPRLRHAHSTTI